MPISYAQAALGATIEVPTLEGTEEMAIPAGTQAGELFKLRRRGMPDPRGRGKGDLLVVVNIEVPKTLTARAGKPAPRIGHRRKDQRQPSSQIILGKTERIFRAGSRIADPSRSRSRRRNIMANENKNQADPTPPRRRYHRRSGNGIVRSDLDEARDKMLRAQAELDNYRKRARRELDDERRYAEINLLRDLLPVQDNIVRAIDAADKKADAATLLEGLKMVRLQLADVLKRHHCEPITGQGGPFDPAMHEAVMQQPSPNTTKTPCSTSCNRATTCTTAWSAPPK